MDNNQGSVLTLTLGLVLVFTLLGLATIHHATVQNETTEQRVASVEAFWLADGGIERAFSGLPAITYYDPANLDVYEPANSNLPLGRGTYNIYSVPQDCDPETGGIQPCPGDQHDIKALGNILGQIREIKASVGKYDVNDAITSHGPIADDCEPNSNAAEIDGNCDEYAAFTFEQVFGLNYNDVVADRDNYYEDPPNTNAIPEPPDRSDGAQTNDVGLWGVTYVYFTAGDPSPGLNINHTEDKQHIDGSGDIIPSLLIIDTTDASKLVTIKIQGGTSFRGIIWIKGEADIQGGTTTNGSIFVDCVSCTNVRVSGTAYISFDGDAVDQVVNDLWDDGGGGPGGGGPPPLRLIVWEECPNVGCSFS